MQVEKLYINDDREAEAYTAEMGGKPDGIADNLSRKLHEEDTKYLFLEHGSGRLFNTLIVRA